MKKLLMVILCFSSFSLFAGTGTIIGTSQAYFITGEYSYFATMEKVAIVVYNNKTQKIEKKCMFPTELRTWIQGVRGYIGKKLYLYPVKDINNKIIESKVIVLGVNCCVGELQKNGLGYPYGYAWIYDIATNAWQKVNETPVRVGTMEHLVNNSQYGLLLLRYAMGDCINVSTIDYSKVIEKKI